MKVITSRPLKSEVSPSAEGECKPLFRPKHPLALLQPGEIIMSGVIRLGPEAQLRWWRRSNSLGGGRKEAEASEKLSAPLTVTTLSLLNPNTSPQPTEFPCLELRRRPAAKATVRRFVLQCCHVEDFLFCFGLFFPLFFFFFFRKPQLSRTDGIKSRGICSVGPVTLYLLSLRSSALRSGLGRKRN